MSWDIDFIIEEDYKNHVETFYNKIVDCTKKKTLSEFNKKRIDPVKMLFSYYSSGKDENAIIEAELLRQRDKTINNFIGFFHQDMFRYIEGWDVPETGFDIINKKDKIFVELKNKFNTMNGASSAKTYMNMQNKILEDDEATCMLVEVISRATKDGPWVITFDDKKKSHKNIRRVSIDKLYQIATGDEDAFYKVMKLLPKTLDEISEGDKLQTVSNDLIEQIKERGQGNFISGIYNLGFSGYKGF